MDLLNRRLFRLRSLLPLLLLSASSHASMLEYSASAKIFNDRIEEARQQAIDSAVQSAILNAGGQLQLQQRSQAGVLQPPSIDWQAQVNQLQLLSETIDDQVLTVTIALELAPQALQPTAANQCHNGKAKVLIPRPQVRYRQQLVIGGLYQLDEAVARVLANTLSGEGHYAFATSLPQLNLELEQPDKQWISALGQQQAGQYVLALMIDDVAAELPPKALGLFERDGQRTIALTATLFDAFDNSQVWQQRYRSEGEWPFKRQDIADTATERFWDSGFGHELQRLLFDLSRDLDAALQCRPLKSRILAINGNALTLDIGQAAGLTVGTVLASQPQSLNWPNQGHLTATVTKLQHQQAVATLASDAAPQGLQIGDWLLWR